MGLGSPSRIDTGRNRGGVVRFRISRREFLYFRLAWNQHFCDTFLHINDLTIRSSAQTQRYATEQSGANIIYTVRWQSCNPKMS